VYGERKDATEIM